MKKFIYKTRKSGGLKRYRPPKSAERVSMMWGKWETVGKFNTLLEACEVFKDVRAVMVFGPGSTEHQITFGGKCVLHIESDNSARNTWLLVRGEWISLNWNKIRNRLDKPETRATVESYEKQLKGGND